MGLKIDWGWRRSAACKGADLRLFFPPDPDDEDWSPNSVSLGAATRERYSRARRYCERCPVAVECLNEAVTTPENAGLWGGFTPDERRQERKRRQRAALKEKGAVNA